MSVFVYRMKGDDRDSCAYFDDNIRLGSTTISGPCFSTTFAQTWSRGSRIPLDYDEVDTFLTREEFERIAEEGVSEDILEKLRSDEALDYADSIMEDEHDIIANEHELDDADVNELLENSPYGYQDRGIVSVVFSGWREAAEEEAWALGYVNDSNDRYFDYDAFADDLSGDERYIELPSGKVVCYNL